MGRRPRPTEDDLVFHALNRGNNRADVFADDGDRQAFLDEDRETGTQLVSQGTGP